MTSIHKFQNQFGDILYIKADFAQAASPLLYSWHDREHFEHSPFQVADARHRPLNACKIIAQWGK